MCCKIWHLCSSKKDVGKYINITFVVKRYLAHFFVSKHLFKKIIA